MNNGLLRDRYIPRVNAAAAKNKSYSGRKAKVIV